MTDEEKRKLQNAKLELSVQLWDVVALVKYINLFHPFEDVSILGQRIAAMVRMRDDIGPWDGTGESPSEQFHKQI